MAIALIIVGAIVLFVIFRLVWMFWRNEELVAGGSWGRQLGRRRKDSPPPDDPDTG